jgi:hypothetical protein
MHRQFRLVDPCATSPKCCQALLPYCQGLLQPKSRKEPASWGVIHDICAILLLLLHWGALRVQLENLHAPCLSTCIHLP